MNIPHYFSLIILLLLLLQFENVCSFSEETVEFEVSEDAKIGTVIGKLDRLDGYSYRLSRGNSKIHFNPDTLQIITISNLDHESENMIDMLIITSPPSIIHLMIKILDVNDNDPQFAVDPQILSIPETAPIGWRVSLSGAIDPDTNSSIQNYGLEENSTKFRIIQADGLVFLEVIEKLDRELVDEYTLRLIAKDEGVPSRSSSCLLNIQILDTNDNFPDFGTRSIDIEYPCGIPSKIFHLNATDLDANENGQISYEIIGESKKYFEISDGWVQKKNNTNVDEYCKREGTCKVTIEASDHGTPPLVSFLDIRIQVDLKGTNNNEPNINIRFYPADHDYIVVQPDDVNGKTLAILSISDPDGPLGTNSSVKIIKGNEDEIFSLISRSNINILTLRNIEKTEKSRYDITFEANDGQLPMEKTTQKTLKIYIKKNLKDIKINIASKMDVEISKNIVIGSYVAHINNNCSNECSFELDDVSNSLFSIDKSTGVVTIKSSDIPSISNFIVRTFLPPPREDSIETIVTVKTIQQKEKIERIHLRRTYQFSIWDNITTGNIIGNLPKANIYTSMDSNSILGVFPDGSIYLSKQIPIDTRLLTLSVILKQSNATQMTTVTVIIRKNKGYKKLECGQSQFEIEENERPGTVIGSFDVNQIVFYELLNMNDILFINGPNLISRVSFDAEKTNSIDFKYRINSLNGISTTCNGTISIIDLNDNPPIFNQQFYEAIINENETVVNVNISSNDGDVTSENRGVEYRLLNYLDIFNIDPITGVLNTSSTSSFSRLNLSIEAINNGLTTRSFVLITCLRTSKIIWKSERVIRVYRNDVPGTIIYKLEIESNEIVDWKFEENETRFGIDSMGNIRLLEFYNDGWKNRTNLELNTVKYEMEIEYFYDKDRNEHANNIEEIDIIDRIDIGLEAVIVRIIPEISYFIRNGTIFFENEIKDDVYIFTEGPANRTIHMRSPRTFHPQTCQSHVLLISEPGHIDANCSIDHKLLTSVSNVFPNMTITNIEESVQTLDLVTSTGSPFMITLIRNQPSEDVKFSSTNVLMLVSSSHSLNVSFGRVTAESSYRIRYYLIETSQITIDSDTGELFLKERFHRNLNDITLVAVVQTGITRAKLTIEVIEDHLHISKSQFVIFAPFHFQINQPIGSIDIGRPDVMIDIIDDYFYIRNNQLYIKQIPKNRFYDLEGIARKSKLSTSFNVTVVIEEYPNDAENDLHYTIEELMPAGSIIGIVPNSKTSKYRLIDMNCGLLIDQMGIIRSSQIFNRSETLNITTKMIEANISKIWNIYVQITEVNNNPPRIMNRPKQLYIGDEYGLRIEDEDGSDIFMEVIAGDPMNKLILKNNGRIRAENGNDIFNATIRIYDQQPPFKYNFEDISIEFLQKHPSPPKCSNQIISIFGKLPKKGDIIGRIETEKVTFRSLNSNNFGVNSITGEIIMISENVRNSEVFDIEVRSYDGMLYSFCQISIEVDYIEESVDEIRDISFSVLETSLPGTGIGKINLTNAIFEIENDDNFTISSFDGIISVNSPLDFETIQNYQITVLIHRLGSTVRKNVSINIINENDEIPRFITGDIVYLSILEEQSAPLIVGSSIAEDLDDSIITYSIVSGNTSLFSVNSTTGQITCLYPIDREKISNYELEIEARDGKGNYDTSKIIINVEDINDNSPIFEQNIYTVDVLENSIIGTKIIKIKAEDEDENGENSRISYSIDDLIQFRIDEATGWISVVGKIDYERNKSITSIITATDHGEPPRYSRVPIIFNILDDNDNSPIIMNSEAEIYIPTDIKKGDIALVIDVRDEDQEDELKYSIVSTDYEINSIGEVRFLKNGNRKTIEVIVEDSAKHTTSKTFTIRQYPGKYPKFDENLKKKLRITEGVRETIGIFGAKGKTVQYGIVESNKCRGYFEILKNATLISKEIIDREKVDKCDIWVIATMKSRDGKNMRSWLRLEIEIMDINDNLPIFEKQLYRFEVKENGGEAMEIGNIKAIDKDENDRISYRIVSGDILHEFVINDNGKIEAIQDLDRETIQQYRLIIEASDSIHISNTTVVIDILDEDDNAPRFSRIFHAEIEENVEVGSFVVQISASDSDLTENHHFFFESMDDEIPFRIDEITGKVYTKDKLDYEKKSSYRIKVRLQDGVWSIETSIFITILNINDNPPIFEKPSYIFLADSTSDLIGNVRAIDQDQDSIIQYSINNPNFHINSMNGEIKMSRNVSVSFLEMIVSATDSKFSSDVDVIVIFKSMWSTERRMYDEKSNGNVIGYFDKTHSTVLPNDAANIDDKNELFLYNQTSHPNDFYILNGNHLVIYNVSVRKSFEPIPNIEIEIPSFTEIGDIIGKIEQSDAHFENSEESPLEVDLLGNIRLKKSLKSEEKIGMVYNDGVWPKNNKTLNIVIRIISEDDEIKRGVIKQEELNSKEKMRNIEVFGFENSTEISLNMINEPNCMTQSELFEYIPNKLMFKEYDIDVGTYQITLSCPEKILVDVNILPVEETNYPEVIYSNEDGFSMKLEEENTKYYLADDNLRSIFDLSENGHFKNKEKLMRGIYKVPINIKKNSAIKKTQVIRVIAQNSDTSNYSNVYVNVIDPPTYPLKTKIFENNRKCESKSGEISGDCVISIEKQQRLSMEGMEISINIEDNKKTSIEAVEIEIICLRDSIANLIVDLRKHYDDMKINIHAVTVKVFDFRYRVIISIIDRNGKMIDSSETKRTLRSYFDRVKPFYIEFVEIRKDPCGGKMDCQLWLKSSNSRIESRFKDQIFNIPSGELSKERKEEEKVEKMEENICGKSGRMRKGDDVCECANGFESYGSCENEMSSYSIVGAGIIEIKAKNYSKIEEMAERDCGGEQKFEMDFRTKKETASLMIVNLEKQKAKFEIIDGFVKFSLIESSSRRLSHPHIELKIDRKINDGKWHRFRFSMQKKKMTIQIDGKGKELKSRINLSLLFTSSNIIIGPSNEFCFRRMIAQNILIYPIENRKSGSVFDVHSNTPISQTCSNTNIKLSNGSSSFSSDWNMTLLIGTCSAALFIILVCISSLLWILVRKIRNNKTGWEDAKEIDAYAVRSPEGSLGFSNLDHFKPQPTPTSKRYQKRSQQPSSGQINMAYF